MSKVFVISTVDYRVGVVFPEYNFRHVWKKKGEKFPIERETLDQLMYEPGVENMFKIGLLYIEDMEVKKELGLEPQEATEPENIIILNEAQMKRYLTVMPIFEFKDAVAKLPAQQRINLAQYAIDNNIADYDKNDVIKKYTNIDVMESIRIKRDSKED